MRAAPAINRDIEASLRSNRVGSVVKCGSDPDLPHNKDFSTCVPASKTNRTGYLLRKTEPLPISGTFDGFRNNQRDWVWQVARAHQTLSKAVASHHITVLHLVSSGAQKPSMDSDSANNTARSLEKDERECIDHSSTIVDDFSVNPTDHMAAEIHSARIHQVDRVKHGQLLETPADILSKLRTGPHILSGRAKSQTCGTGWINQPQITLGTNRVAPIIVVSNIRQSSAHREPRPHGY